MFKYLCITALLGPILVADVVAAPTGCREVMVVLPDVEKNMAVMASTTAVFLMEPDQRRSPGVFYAIVSGSKQANVLIGGNRFVCEYEVGPECPQLREVVAGIKRYKPEVGKNFDKSLDSVYLHATRYSFHIRTGQSSKASFSTYGPEDSSLVAHVESSRTLLEKCMPDGFAEFIESKLKNHFVRP